jgi:hypothetical protein
MKKTTDVLKGKIEDFKRVPTHTENSMVTFKVAGTPCKAFGKGAETVSRWIKFDPNIAGEFEGYFETHSQKFGREFVAVHGKAIQTERTDNVHGTLMAASGAGAPSAGLISTPSGSVKPIPAKEPSGFKAEFAVKPSATLSHVPPVRRVIPVDDFVHVEGVTFEDLENQYKSQKAGGGNGKAELNGETSGKPSEGLASVAIV